jgi:hypothetical protein
MSAAFAMRAVDSATANRLHNRFGPALGNGYTLKLVRSLPKRASNFEA